MEAVNGKAGETRSALRRDYLLHTPDAFLRTPLPGMTNGLAIVHASPELGARFLMYTAELQPHGILAALPSSVPSQRFVWVLAGEIDLAIDTARRALAANSYAYLQSGSPARITAVSAAALLVIEKPYHSLDGVAPPQSFSSSQPHVPGLPLAGDPALTVQSLLPTSEAFDFAVNIMTYAPGASLAQVEVHVMEHGLLMLAGSGTYRLGDDRLHVQAGDAIWMAPYCPQWFIAEPDAPAKYLIYKDWNRRPRL